MDLARRRFLLGAIPRGAEVVRREVAPEPPPPPRVEVDPARCIAFRGPECGACGGWCPEAAPSALRLRLGRPVIDPDACAGCGLCIPACPMTPSALSFATPG